MNRKTLVVLGMHRSGTSLVAGIIEKFGCYMGSRLFNDLRSNPMGHFEDLDFMDLNVEILEKAGGDWASPPAECEVLKLESTFSARINERIKANNSCHNLWGWKDPRNSLTVKLFASRLTNPFYVYCTRDEMAVAESLRKRNGFSITKGIALKEEYDKRIRAFLNTVDSDRIFHVTYERIQADPEGFVREFAMFLQVDIADSVLAEAVAMILPRRQLEALKAKVLRKLRRKALIRIALKRPWSLPFYLIRKYVLKAHD